MLLGLARPARPALPRVLYQGSDAHQVALPGRPLVPMHFTYASVINLKLELEEVWGDDGFHLVKGFAS